MQKVSIGFGKNKYIISVNTNSAHQPAQSENNRHSNAQYELHISLQGNYIIDVERESYNLSKRQALLIAPGQYHFTQGLCDSTHRLVIPFMIQCDKEAADTFYNQVYPCSLIQLSDFDLLLCNMIEAEIKEQRTFWYENVCSLYTLIISTVLRALSHRITDEDENDPIKDDRRLMIIDDFFEKNLTENSTMETLSSLVNLSRRQLNRVIKIHYGMSFRDKLRQARMDRAEWLLRTTNMSVEMICDSVGYQSAPSFYKGFKIQFGVSPREYRLKCGVEKREDKQTVLTIK